MSIRVAIVGFCSCESKMAPGVSDSEIMWHRKCFWWFCLRSSQVCTIAILLGVYTCRTYVHKSFKRGPAGDWATWVEFTELTWGDRCIGSVAVTGVVYRRHGIETARNPCYQMFMILLGICSLSTAASLFLVILVPAFATLITVEPFQGSRNKRKTLQAFNAWRQALLVYGTKGPCQCTF